MPKARVYTEVKIKSKHNKKLLNLPRSLCEVQGWDVYETLPSWVDSERGALFGMVAYVRCATLKPSKAEKSLMLGKRNKELKKRDRIGSYATFQELNITEALSNKVDGEGRNLVIDLGILVLIFVCAIDPSAARYFCFCDATRLTFSRLARAATCQT